MLGVAEQFSAAILTVGLTPPNEMFADGHLHRFPSNDERGDGVHWYVLYQDSIPAGMFEGWRAELREKEPMLGTPGPFNHIADEINYLASSRPRKTVKSAQGALDLSSWSWRPCASTGVLR